MWLVAGRDITAGEALTSKDGYELDEQDAYPCCGCMLASPYWGLLRNKAIAS
jgi:hypothetical protein